MPTDPPTTLDKLGLKRLDEPFYRSFTNAGEKCGLDQTGFTALQLAAMLGNTGAQSAIEQATTVRPPDYEKLNALGNFSQRLRAATTEEGKKAILEREAASMVKRGWMTEEERKALLQAIENLGD